MALIASGKIIASLGSYIKPNFVTHLLLSSVKTTLSTLSHIFSETSVPEIIVVKTKIESMDLQNKLEIIHSLIEELKEENLKDFQKKSIKNISELIQKINVELDDINNKIIYHKSKYFSSWRSLYLDDNINILIEHNKLLDTRFQFLINLLSIHV
jgi:hypothetical protein